MAWCFSAVACTVAEQEQPADLPPEFSAAHQIAVMQTACNADPYEGPPEYLVWDAPASHVTYRNAHFRCQQPVCGYAMLEGDAIDVLVQPCEMNPTSPKKCDCLSDVGLAVPKGVTRVGLSRRWDSAAGQESPPVVAIGEIELTSHVSCHNGLLDGAETDVDCGGAGDCDLCGTSMACADGADCESGVCDAMACASGSDTNQ